MSFLARTWKWLTSWGGGDDETEKSEQQQQQQQQETAPRKRTPEEIRRLRIQKFEQERELQRQKEAKTTQKSQTPAAEPASVSPSSSERSKESLTTSGLVDLPYSDAECLHDAEELAAEECLRVSFRKQYWKRPLSLGVKDSSITDLSESFATMKDDNDVTPMQKENAETLIVLVMELPHEDLLEFFVESHARLSEEARSLNLFNVWTNRKSVKAREINCERVQTAYVETLETWIDLVTMYIGVILVCPDTAASSRVAPSAERFIDFVLDDSFAGGDGSYTPRFKPSYGQPASLLYTLNKCLPPEDLQVIVLALTEALVRKSTSADSLGKLNSCQMLIMLMTRYKRIAEAMTSSPRWIGGNAGNGRAMEALTPLGLLFTVSPLSSLSCCAKLAKEFENPLHRDLSLSRTSIRDIVSAANKVAALALEELLGENGTDITRKMTLKWINCVLQANKEREKMRYNTMIVSSNGFLGNLAQCLVTFVSRHISAAEDIQNLDPCYPLEHPDIVQFNDSSLIGFTDEEAKDYVHTRQKKVGGPRSDFINTLFYYASCCFHLGYIRLAHDHSLIRNNIGVLSHNLETLRVDAGHDAEARSHAERTESELAQLVQLHLCHEVHLTDEEYLDHAAEFMSVFSQWVVSKLPVPETESDAKLPDEFSVMPTVMMQDLGDFFQNSTEYGYCFLPETLNPIIELIVRVLGSSYHLKAAFIRPKFVEGIDALMSQEHNSQRPDVQTMLENNGICRARLIPALLQMHTDVDQAKGDKVQFRYSILRVAQRVLQIPAFVKSLNDYANEPKNSENVQRFLMDLVHDVSKAMTDAIDCLERIHNGDSSAPVAQEARQNMQLLNVRFEFLKLFVTSMDAGLRSSLPEMVSNALSGLLVFSMSNLVGVPSLRLKVPSPEKYNFNALNLFRWTACTVVSLIDNTAFVQSVAENPQAKEGDVLQHVYRKLRQYHVLENPDDISRFEAFAQRVGDLDTSWLDGDHPDEFVDQISGTLMLDPVRLPSGNVIDRATLERLFVDSNLDPFTRVPMTMEDAKPDTELRDKIAEYIKTLKQQKLSSPTTSTT